MPANNPIYKRTQEHVSEMFRTHHPHHLVFHNLQHTAGVVKKVNEIADNYRLSEDDLPKGEYSYLGKRDYNFCHPFPIAEEVVK